MCIRDSCRTEHEVRGGIKPRNWIMESASTSFFRAIWFGRSQKNRCKTWSNNVWFLKYTYCRTASTFLISQSKSRKGKIVTDEHTLEHLLLLCNRSNDKIRSSSYRIVLKTWKNKGRDVVEICVCSWHPCCLHGLLIHNSEGSERCIWEK